ncbi:hypothetical protein SUGI_1492310 [Cryptomeria japonica]|uniref:Uncharacterized protein n=1 Tax=Cryptomeria japonica TaxID=3369 RepID=A0AAD3RRK0_CRYJA|nr:hypothetical protein SUGI_1469170 [Cryptomeria japonica]GLJ59090.1 hypothetical protein SUGI_1492310 [Cryptomeria japonica]
MHRKEIQPSQKPNSEEQKAEQQGIVAERSISKNQVPRYTRRSSAAGMLGDSFGKCEPSCCKEGGAKYLRSEHGCDVLISINNCQPAAANQAAPYQFYFLTAAPTPTPYYCARRGREEGSGPYGQRIMKANTPRCMHAEVDYCRAAHRGHRIVGLDCSPIANNRREGHPQWKMTGGA